VFKLIFTRKLEYSITQNIEYARMRRLYQQFKATNFENREIHDHGFTLQYNIFEEKKAKSCQFPLTGTELDYNRPYTFLYS
jgi:hypothetical protein